MDENGEEDVGKRRKQEEGSGGVLDGVEGLSEAERQEAEKYARIARMAEEKAKKRMEERERERRAAAKSAGGVLRRPDADVVADSKRVAPVGLTAVVTETAKNGGELGLSPPPVQGKVRFLTKKEREKQALERLEAKRREMEEKRKAEAEMRKALFSKASDAPVKMPSSSPYTDRDDRRRDGGSDRRDGRDRRSSSRDRGSSRSRSRYPRDDDRRRSESRSRRGDDDRSRRDDRGRSNSRYRDGRREPDRDDSRRGGRDESRGAGNDGNDSLQQHPLDAEEEKEAIKQRYLGAKKSKRIVIKPSEKFARSVTQKLRFHLLPFRFCTPCPTVIQL